MRGRIKHSRTNDNVEALSLYDADGKQVRVKDPMLRITTTTFDVLDRPIVVTDPMGTTTTTYDADRAVSQASTR